MNLRENWRKIVLIAVGVLLVGIPLAFLLYVAFLLGRYTRGVKVTFNKPERKMSAEDETIYQEADLGAQLKMPAEDESQ